MTTQALWTRESRFPCEPRSASLARAFVSDHLRQHDLPYLVDDMQLVVSELVTNAVRYSGSAIDLELEERQSCVVLTVRDQSSGSPVARSPNPADTGGRGLMIVAETSLKWGFDLEAGGGKSTWVMFALRPARGS